MFLLGFHLRLCVLLIKFRASRERFRDLDDPVGRHFPRHGETFKMSADSQWCLSLCIQLFQNWRNGGAMGCRTFVQRNCKWKLTPASLPRPSPQSVTLLPPVKAKKSYHKAHACATERVIPRSSSYEGWREGKKGRRKEAATGISATAFCTGQGGDCTLVDTSVRNVCPWGVAISISPLLFASPASCLLQVRSFRSVSTADSSNCIPSILSLIRCTFSGKFAVPLTSPCTFGLTSETNFDQSKTTRARL